jgi:hypothetical protein
MLSAHSRSTIPEIPPHLPEPHVVPPMVFVQPVWEYKHLLRPLPAPGPLSEAELNALGGDGWELVAVYPEPASLHFYFKRLQG